MKIGFLPLYIALYDEVSPAKRPDMERFAAKIVSELENRGFEVAASPVCRIRDEFAAAVKMFESSDCQAIATLHLAYSPSLESADIIAGTDLPVVVIDTTPDYEFTAPAGIMDNHGIHGVQDFCNLLLRRGKRFQICCGHWEKSDCLDRAAKMLTGAAMAQRMNNLRVGLVGGHFAGMGDFRVPDGTFNIVKVDYTEQPEADEASIAAEIAADRKNFDCQTFSDEVHRRTIAASLKLRRWAEREKLDAFTINFPGITESSGWATVPFLECSKAMTRGIGYAGEGDILTAGITAVLLGVFKESSFAEMFCPDWKNDRIFTSHMGEINLSLCSTKPNLHEVNYKFSPTGNPVVATGCFKSGDAVLVDLAPGADGKFTLITAEVSFEAPDAPSEAHNAGYFKVKNSSIGEFLEAYSKVGGTHHLTVCYNADKDIIRSFADAMGWEYAGL